MPGKFNYIKNGYSPDEVDNYIDSLENVVKSYKEKDSAIKNAIISAQVAAENIVRNAELEAQGIKQKALNELQVISNSVVQQKEHIRKFQNDYNLMLGKYLKPIEENDLLNVYSSVNEMESYLYSLKKQINENGSEDKALF